MSRRNKVSKAEKTEALARLSEFLPDGATIFCVITHVAKSGMSRRMKLYTAEVTNMIDGPPKVRMVFLTGMVCNALGYRWHDASQSLVISGCGMDMCWAVVHDIGGALKRDFNKEQL